MATKRKLDPRLTHRIVSADGHWARGATLAEAKAEFRKVRGKPFAQCKGGAVWAVTAETTINELGRFTIPGEFVQPADVS